MKTKFEIVLIAAFMGALVVLSSARYAKADDDVMSIEEKYGVAHLKVIPIESKAGNLEGEQLTVRFGVTDGDFLAGSIQILYSDAPRDEQEGVGKIVTIGVPHGNNLEHPYTITSFKYRDADEFGKVRADARNRMEKKPLEDTMIGRLNDGSKVLFFVEIANARGKVTDLHLFSDLTELPTFHAKLAAWVYQHSLGYDSELFQKWSLPGQLKKK